MAGRFLIVANWKMHPVGSDAARKLFDATKRIAVKHPKASFVVAPPALYLSELTKRVPPRMQLALQDAEAEDSGAKTGCISLAQGRGAGASAVIIGHAERRALGECDEAVGRKVERALALRLMPIVCVGEEVRGSEGEHFTRIREQVRAAFSGVPKESAKKSVLAYEPLWAIGVDTPMDPTGMHEMAIYLRKVLAELWGDVASAEAVRILYGGSVFPGTVHAFLEEGCVSGFLLGRSALDQGALARIAEELYDSK